MNLKNTLTRLFNKRILFLSLTSFGALLTYYQLVTDVSFLKILAIQTLSLSLIVKTLELRDKTIFLEIEKYELLEFLKMVFDVSDDTLVYEFCIEKPISSKELLRILATPILFYSLCLLNISIFIFFLTIFIVSPPVINPFLLVISLPIIMFSPLVFITFCIKEFIRTKKLEETTSILIPEALETLEQEYEDRVYENFNKLSTELSNVKEKFINDGISLPKSFDKTLDMIQRRSEDFFVLNGKLTEYKGNLIKKQVKELMSDLGDIPIRLKAALMEVSIIGSVEKIRHSQLRIIRQSRSLNVPLRRKVKIKILKNDESNNPL